MSKITNMSPQAYHHINLVVVKQSAFITLKLWTINDNSSQKVTIRISKSGLTHFPYLIGV